MKNIEKITLVAAIGWFVWYWTKHHAMPAPARAPESYAPPYVNYNYPIGMTGAALDVMPSDSIGYNGIPSNDNKNACAICSLFSKG